MRRKLTEILTKLNKPLDNALESEKEIYDFIESVLENTPPNIQFGPEGSYRESLIRSYLKEILPQPSAVGTGFILNENNSSSKQIDIIIYDPRIPTLFNSDDLVVVVPEAVYGIIEVKTTHRSFNFKKELENANINGELITKPLKTFLKENNFYIDNEVTNDYFFNGIFYYSLVNDIYTKDGLFLEKEQRDRYIWEAEDYKNVNYIAFSSSVFGRRYGEEFSYYDMNKKQLAFSYFFSNLIRIIMNRNNVSSEAINNHIFPIDDPNGKESLKIIRVNGVTSL